MSKRGYIALSLELEAKAIMVNVEGMKAENTHRLNCGHSVAHTEESFEEEAVKLRDLAKQVAELIEEG